SPAYLGSMASFLTSAPIRAAFDHLTEAVRRGGTAIGPEGTLEPENPMWVEFARSMAPLAGLTAELLNSILSARRSIPGSVLDIAAGHGLYGVTLARHHPEARVIAQDWSNVLQVAEENARKAGVTDRFEKRPGSAFDVDFGTGHTLVLLTNFLHHFDPKT